MENKVSEVTYSERRKFDGERTTKLQWQKVLSKHLNPVDYNMASTFMAIEDCGDDIILEKGETYLQFAYTCIRDMALDCLGDETSYYGNEVTEEELDKWVDTLEYYKRLILIAKKLYKADKEGK